MERLILTPEDPMTMRPNKGARFVATLESSDEVICKSAQPLADGARELLARGYAAKTMLTMRHHDAVHDSFPSMPISYWAGLSYTEGKSGIRKVVWMPRADVPERQKSGSDDPSGTSPPKTH